MNTLKTGSEAYYDSFAGLIPCRVDAVSGTSGPGSTRQIIRATITRTCMPYRKGDQVEVTGLHVIPANAIRRRQRNATAIAPFNVEAD
jgi:hypothetical protein